MKKLITLTLFLGLFSYTYACSCFYISEYFCPTMNWVMPYNEQNQVFIIRAKVQSINGHLMQVKLVENLFSEITEEEFFVIGQDGLNCNQYLSVFDEGQEVILALYNAFEEGRYNLNGCGRFFLHLDGENVVGPISQTADSQPYNDFKSRLGDCFQITDIDTPANSEAVCTIAPNPCRDQIQIQLPDNAGSHNQVFVFNAKGELLQTQRGNSSTEKMDLSPYPAGLYFVKVVQGNQTFTQKVVKI